MNYCVLGSGSKGNCTLVESGSTSILIDAGFSGIEVRRRLALVNRSEQDITAILITHEHGDHIGGVGVLSRRCNLPVYANYGTHTASEHRVGSLYQRYEFATGQGFVINDLQIHPFRISHDTTDPVGFVISDAESAVAYCTDTGKITNLIRQRISGCQALILEANYDPKMLMDGPYPMHIKQRVRSSQGHLSNQDSGRFLAEQLNSRLSHVILAHLSETNNLPTLARNQVVNDLADLQPDFSIDLAWQGQPTPIFSI
jgi:phosphoribosyl 1,2-cyclic phosphodiesterase